MLASIKATLRKRGLAGSSTITPPWQPSVGQRARVGDRGDRVMAPTPFHGARALSLEHTSSEWRPRFGNGKDNGLGLGEAM